MDEGFCVAGGGVRGAELGELGAEAGVCGDVDVWGEWGGGGHGWFGLRGGGDPWGRVIE